MNMKKVISGFMATAIVASMASISAFAVAPPATPTLSMPFAATAPAFIAYDSDGAVFDPTRYKTNAGNNANINFDPIAPNSTVYIPISTADFTVGARVLDADDWGNTKLWDPDVDKDVGSKLVKSISVISEKDLGGAAGLALGRATFIKIVLNDSMATDEQKFEGVLTLKAKKTSDLTAANNGNASTVSVLAGDKLIIPIKLWVSNDVLDTSDGSTEPGNRIVFKPTENENNTLVWGDDRAALYFEANDDAGKFYARMSTSSDSTIYAEYGDPANADLWFYDFIGNPTVPATSRATLTLGIPWTDDDTISTAPEDCFIYTKDADGLLTDVTSQFTFSDSNDETTGIEGWTIKTRTLGTYIISDTELDLGIADEIVDEEPTTDEPTTVEPGKDIPNTGSSDMVNVAVVAAVVSLAAAGAVAFRKAK